jgi:tRNA G10  N-methylase Trm11
VTNGANDTPSQRPHERRKVVQASCSVHQVARGFTNLAVSKRNGEIMLDPHVDGSCLLTLAEDAACVLRDALTELLG